MKKNKQKALEWRIDELQRELKVYREAAAGDIPLGKCKSNMCLGCRYAVVYRGGSGIERLVGCAKDCLCVDFSELRTSKNNCDD